MVVHYRLFSRNPVVGAVLGTHRDLIINPTTYLRRPRLLCGVLSLVGRFMQQSIAELYYKVEFINVCINSNRKLVIKNALVSEI